MEERPHKADGILTVLVVVVAKGEMLVQEVAQEEHMEAPIMVQQELPEMEEPEGIAVADSLLGAQQEEEAQVLQEQLQQ